MWVYLFQVQSKNTRLTNDHLVHIHNRWSPLDFKEMSICLSSNAHAPPYQCVKMLPTPNIMLFRDQANACGTITKVATCLVCFSPKPK